MRVAISTEKLKQYVIHSFMSTNELVAASGVSFGTISHMWSTPVKNVNSETAGKLCKALNITLSDILAE